ncbi:hypothetical protein [Allosphingosinicella deserti]|uniref:hypothetical protein n=1 Tax=Allosphingosinicella deserti TaxID=2116704 RepID=UPI00130490E5|nr:hypothetical protein [Sphingomonas deserti]
MIVIAMTRASWTHSKVQWRTGRSVRAIAARIDAPNIVKGTSQSGDTGALRIIPPLKILSRTGHPRASHTASAAMQKIQRGG